MNKLAIFVEGGTEVGFVYKLLLAIAGQNNIRIEIRRIKGGASVPRRFMQIRAAQPDTGQQYYVLIVNCVGDSQVKTRIMEEHENLTRSGYQKIIGIRDVYPNYTYAEIPRLEASLPLRIRTSLIPVQFILGIMEIESWFLGETSHFSRINLSITIPAIITALGFNPETDDLQLRPQAAEDLDRCYALGGCNYRKQFANNTIEALDYGSIYCDLLNRFPYLHSLVTSIETFLTT